MDSASTINRALSVVGAIAYHQLRLSLQGSERGTGPGDRTNGRRKWKARRRLLELRTPEKGKYTACCTLANRDR
jgi:hypothetical protein